MSDVVKCTFYYGHGTVLINELGADLSQFQYSELELNSPQTWSISQVKDWLAGCLGLNPEIDTVGVHVLWSKSRSRADIFFYLRPIDRTSQWVRWLQACETRGTNPVALLLPVANEVNSYVGEGGHEPGQSSQEMHTEEHDYSQSGDVGGGGYESGENSQTNPEDDHTGEVDADEQFGHMQNQMEEEDTDGDSADADDSDESDDELEVPNPASWNHDYTSAMTVNDGHDSAWQYHENNIAVGALYPDKQHLQDAIIKWAMSTARVFRTKVSSKKYLTMEC